MAEYAKTSPTRLSWETVSARAASRRSSSPSLEGRSATSDLDALHAALNQAPGPHAVAQLHHALNQSPRVRQLTTLSGVLRTGAIVQRAVVAIDGASDDATAKAITRSCLSNLTTRKRIRTPDGGGRTPTHFPAGNARGATYGPDVAAATFKALAGGVANSQVGTDESLYVLGHGDGTTVGGLDAPTLATRLGDSFAKMPDQQVYRGDVKLIACYSGSLIMDGEKIVDPKTKQPIDKTYAESLANELTASKTPKFQPSGAQGIAGIAWVDELSGRPTGLDVLGEKQGILNPAERLYTEQAKTKSWFAAMQESDPQKRREGMEKILDAERKPGEESLRTRVFGKDAKRRFLTK